MNGGGRRARRADDDVVLLAQPSFVVQQGVECRQRADRRQGRWTPRRARVATIVRRTATRCPGTRGVEQCRGVQQQSSASATLSGLRGGRRNRPCLVPCPGLIVPRTAGHSPRAGDRRDSVDPHFSAELAMVPTPSRRHPLLLQQDSPCPAASHRDQGGQRGRGGDPAPAAASPVESLPLLPPGVQRGE